MIIQCPNCYQKYKFDESKFEGKPKKKVKCRACGTVFEIKNPALKKETEESTKISTTKKELKEIKEAIHNKAFKENKYSLAVLSGPLQGKVMPITKPIITIGRAKADIVIPDPEISRTHCEIVILPDKIVLKDLNSTNGTYFDNLKISKTEIGDKDEFSIGDTTLMLIITPKNPENQV